MRRSFKRLFCSKAITPIKRNCGGVIIGIGAAIMIVHVVRTEMRRCKKANKFDEFHSDKVHNGSTYVYKTYIKNPASDQESNPKIYSEVEVINVDKYKNLIDNRRCSFAFVSPEDFSSVIYYEMNKKISKHLTETIDDLHPSGEDHISDRIFIKERKEKIRAGVNDKFKKYGLRVNSIKTSEDLDKYNKNSLCVIIKRCVGCN